ncbi:NAD(P)/FAD-dependent oxidoreductase [Acidiferrimicrobium sp. IK]|uniref:NAD(P)/FAD-dependent oxidoreductase n=1 Tax=Acidiferrimicrobium sp. IK TaxID=2871700 RepID=UPI0021CB6ADA|nr:NAD(P)/FAD-dependent oxidoreductase [Acidiferrimicrobium sp. IK]MCU4183545.1 NAD(P)/FAD-dependent oxidoreductase [Acidiferrimicrobium sp. IK]
MPVRPRVVVIGSGFGGLAAVGVLAGTGVDVVVVDRDNYHGFWPLLYQVATAGLGPDDIAAPIRAIHAGKPNVEVRMGLVCGIDPPARQVELTGGERLAYDYLIVAAGSSSADFGIPGVHRHAYTLKTLPDAVRLRNHVLSMFERAENNAVDGHPGAADLTTVVVGGGSTGVEMAGALSELISHNLAGEYRHLDVGRARVVLVEMTDTLLPGYSRRSQDAAVATLRQKGVEMRFATSLASVEPDGVTLKGGERIQAATVVWTAGVKANPLVGCLPGAKEKGGRTPVADDLSVPGHPEVFVIGDAAATRDRRGELLPQVAQVAIQGGRHAARQILRRQEGRPARAFRYRDHGTMATIGRRAAVAELPGGVTFAGTFGWLAWLAVHLVFLVGFRNRAVVLLNWAWNYLTWDRASRVILPEGTGPETTGPPAAHPG